MKGPDHVNTVAATNAPRKKRKHRPYATLSPQAKKTKNAANKHRVKRRDAEAANG